MSKIIKLTPDYIEECKKEFEKALTTSKFADGKISYTKNLGSLDEKATIYFSDMAWIKMQALIQKFDKEIAWHGVAHRGEDEKKHDYYITDILVYPQSVTGASVEMDVDKYAEWLIDNYEDERFNHIGMQGHSHVNMQTTPSGVDLTHQEEILEQLDDTMFYIFMIWNKSGSKNIKIYDMKKNIMFETSDTEVKILPDGYNITEFIDDAKSIVKDRNLGYSSVYGGYNKQLNSVNNSTDQKNDKIVSVKTEPDNKNDDKSKKRKGKRKKIDKKEYDYTKYYDGFYNSEYYRSFM